MEDAKISQLLEKAYLRIALAVPELKALDPQTNATRQARLYQELEAEDPDLLVFPALSLSGLSLGDALYQADLLHACILALEELATVTRNARSLLITSLPLLWQGEIYFSLALLGRGKIQALQALPVRSASFKGLASNLPEEDGLYYSPSGQKIPLFFKSQCFFLEDAPEKRFILALEEENIKLSGDLAEETGLCKIIFALSRQSLGQSQLRHTLYAASSRQSDSAFALLAPPASESSADGSYAGERMVYEAGELLAAKKIFEKDTLLVDIDLDYLAMEAALHARQHPAKTKRSVSCARAVVRGAKKPVIKRRELARKINALPFLADNPSTEANNAYYEDALSLLSQGLLRRMSALGEPKLILGLSGGLDSCLAMLICLRALELAGRPHKDLIAVSMPGPGSHERTQNNARELAREVESSFYEIPIEKALNQHLEDIQQTPGNFDSTYENAQARERTQILMDLANRLGGLVIGTGDLSELALGWCTYNGDQMSMYSVNSSVPKTLVRALCQYEAERFSQHAEKFSALIFDVLATPISPELLPKGKQAFMQKTEDFLGPYDLQDFFLWHYLRRHASVSKLYFLALQGFSTRYAPDLIRQSLETFLYRFVREQFKRSALPEGANLNLISLSPRTGYYQPGDLRAASFLDFLEH